jgi:hypothetical protein
MWHSRQTASWWRLYLATRRSGSGTWRQERRESILWLASRATKQPGYRILSREIISERLRQRTALLKQLQKTWDLEHQVNEVELQLSGFKFDQEVKTTLDLADDMPPALRRLVETMMTLPGTTLEEEFHRRNAAINAVAAYCKFQEGGAATRPRGRPPTGKASPIPAKETSPALGPDHTLTLNTVNNLGLLYKDQGKLKETVEMLQCAVIAYEKALGPDYISTLNTVNNLGLLYTTGDQLGTPEFHSGQCSIYHH